MICPKCRTKYPEGISVCPDCGVDLIALLGEADAPADEDFEAKKSRWKSSYQDEQYVPQTVEIYADRSAEGFEEELSEAEEQVPNIQLAEEDFHQFEEKKYTQRFHEVVVNGDDEFSPVVYKSNSEAQSVGSKRGSNALGVFFLIVSILFIAASVLMFWLGRRADTQAALGEVEAGLISLIGPTHFTF